MRKKVFVCVSGGGGGGGGGRGRPILGEGEEGVGGGGGGGGWGVGRTDPWSPEMDHPPLGRSYLVVVPSYEMSCALILLTGLYGWDSMADIDINPSSMGPMFDVWLGLTIGVLKCIIRH